MSGSFDVFLSHNSQDKPMVRQLAIALQERGLKVWLDEWELIPGRRWQEALEEIIQTTRTAAVLVGKDGLGPWEIPEMYACLSEFVNRRLPVIPVLLPGAPTKPKLPMFLHGFTWVDLRGGLTEDSLDRLEWGITSVKPSQSVGGSGGALRANIVGITSDIVGITSAKPSQSVGGTEDRLRPENPIRVLHLSDLHITADCDPTTLLQPLIADLKDKAEGLGFEELDYLVVSGDLTNYAQAEEFEKAYQFISRLIKDFRLSAQRCIIVPGNHDLSWKAKAYDLAHDIPKGQKDGSYLQKDDVYLVRNENEYPKRFENFSKFYHELLQQEYPLKVESQCLVFPFEEHRLQFLALNSAWEIDRFFRQRSSINDSALSSGLHTAEEQIKKAKAENLILQNASVLRIAVWHHPITGNEKIEKDAFLDRLRQADFKLCLHGHVHEDRTDVIGYLHPVRKIYIAGAGSFGAPVRERPESIPRLYNVLEIQRDHSKIRVHTRCLRKDGGAWEGWAVWPGEKPTERRIYYDIPLT